MRYRATLAYDGTAYQGFQRQSGSIPTIQGAVEAAIFNASGQKVNVSGAGRTDTGVHASGQVIAFDVEWTHADQSLLRAVNFHLPLDIALQDIRQQPGFHPRYDAISRLYRYRVLIAPQRQPLLLTRAWQMWNGLDGELMEQASKLFIGEKDFAALGKPTQGEVTIRSVYRSEWVSQQNEFGTLWTYTVEADGFLQHMVRRMVAMLVQVGHKRMTVQRFEELLNRAKLVEALAIAPPQGLSLEVVRYNE
ncbi:MAG: tRNA pseudouridine(38-40) synthase TruA [Anaerolineaceae bacterium]|nr:tRNA pseudouridine(38-40) synthase TruA [Anaerolineaceae bacterium]